MNSDNNHAKDRPDFLGGLSYQRFIDRHWQKQPLFVAGAFPEWTDCLAPDELAGFALEETVESRILIERGPHHWELQQGPFSENSFQHLPKEKWTLLIQALDHYVPEFASLLDEFNFLPQWRIDDLMMSYATTGGSVGPHYDYYDVFLIQISGTRHWQIGQHCNDHSPIVDGLPVRILKDFQSEQEWKAQPGDMLYLPPGVAHHGVALDDDCLTLSVGFRAPSYADILSEYSHHIASQLPGELRYQDPGLRDRSESGRHSGLLDESDIDRVRSQIQLLLNDREALTTWMAAYLSMPKYEHIKPEPSALGDHEIEQYLAEHDTLQRDENSRFIWISRPTPALYINGEKYPFPQAAVELAESITTRRRFPANSLREKARNSEARNWLKQLIRQGLLYFYEP